jgi:hypothetical protein
MTLIIAYTLFGMTDTGIAAYILTFFVWLIHLVWVLQ